MRGARPSGLAALLFAIVQSVAPAALTAPLASSATEARLDPSTDGHVGVWLVTGPFDRASTPLDHLSPRLDAPVSDAAGAPRWRLAWASDGPIDMAAALGSPGGDRTALAAGVLHLETGGPHLLLIGADDGVSVMVDGARVYSCDDARPERDDDDLVPLDLGAGDHTVVLALHGRGSAWRFRLRLLDGQLQPPTGSWWRFPGTTAGDARALATRMSSVALDRVMDSTGYQPVLTVRFSEGTPRDVRLDVHARLARTSGQSPPLFDLDEGEIPVGDRGVEDLAVALPYVPGAQVEDDDWSVHVDVAGRPIDLPMHPRRALRETAALAARAVEEARAAPGQWLLPATLESVEHLRDRLVGFVASGDGDVAAQLDEARELNEISASLAQHRDPYGTVAKGGSWRAGPTRRAYRSPVDGRLSEFAVYLPPDFDPTRKYPLVVALHGMNGHPMQMLMWLFGRDDPARNGAWEDRHPARDLPPLEAVVVAPDGHSNAGYRELGEDDVMRVVDWAMATYPIDPSRVTVTGPSMGGIGTAACALHHPDRFAAAEPLCGYHSYFVRSDIAGRTLRPWERFIAEQRSNVFWAENGRYLPLYVVHGTKDLPEENSGVLIDRYEELHYKVKHEHPALGHNVWQTTYEDMKGVHWLLEHRRPIHPRSIRFKTAGTRWADDAWIHVRELASSDVWGEIAASIGRHNAVYVATKGVGALALDRDTDAIDDAARVTVGIDGDRLEFEAGEPIELHRDRGRWRAGAAAHDGPYKSGTVTGPLRDAFHEPLLFVWGASDPAQSRANEEVAHVWARVRGGVRVGYPLMSDVEFYARGESLANDHALFLVGNARSNRVVRDLEPSFPIRIDGDGIVFGARRIEPKDGGTAASRSQLGAAFIRPNPRRPDRYVVVIEGTGPLGTWRSLALPDILPDYLVFDEDVGPAHGGLLLGAGHVRAGGFFGPDWSLPP